MRAAAQAARLMVAGARHAIIRARRTIFGARHGTARQCQTSRQSWLWASKASQPSMNTAAVRAMMRKSSQSDHSDR